MPKFDDKYICDPSSLGLEGHIRYVLKPNPSRGKSLFVIGMNPSYANEKILDPTVENVKNFAEKYFKDNGIECHFVMLNLCPWREPNSKKLDDLPNDCLTKFAFLDDNAEQIMKELNSDNPTIFACWGKGIFVNTKLRDYFVKSLLMLSDKISKMKNVKWVRIKTLNETAYPTHPSNQSKRLWASKDYQLVDWCEKDVEKYMEMVKRKKCVKPHIIR